jgi:uncharacterized protein (DUF2235 family)
MSRPAFESGHANWSSGSVQQEQHSALPKAAAQGFRSTQSLAGFVTLVPRDSRLEPFYITSAHRHSCKKRRANDVIAGIGTYVTTNSYSHTSLFSRMNSWYQKAKDSAVGTSFDAHVMGGYKFLMRYYSPGDDIFFFGFSRGAYIARFLAEMLDYVGLLTAGNEELARFAWKTFSQWQQRLGGVAAAEQKKKEMFRFMKAFRETFSRPVKRIRFLGLFDTVNSVPRFESAWMERSKFPYTARSSAKVIRHAVGIDERRAKFRQDLLSGDPVDPNAATHRHGTVGRARRLSEWVTAPAKGDESSGAGTDPTAAEKPSHGVDRYRANARGKQEGRTGRGKKRLEVDNQSPRYRPSSRRSRSQLRLSGESQPDGVPEMDGSSQISLELHHTRAELDLSDSDSDGEAHQDIEEVWFPGCHADIGGGWNLADGEEFPLSHAPLVWMVREARKAGLGFDYDKMKDLHCCDDAEETFANLSFEASNPPTVAWNVPRLEVSGSPLPEGEEAPAADEPSTALEKSRFHRALETAATKGMMHDCLSFNNGLPAGSVISWRIMEWLPFRRMDLQPDGSWKPIRWPLPQGETRDIPSSAKIHNSAIKRMQANETYRPGNLIVGGGGRGIQIAPPEYGTGTWVIWREQGDHVGEVFLRKDYHDGETFTGEPMENDQGAKLP